MSTATLHTATKKALVPQLRFSGFEEEWELKKLGDISKITTGSTPSTLIEEYYNGEKLFVSPFDIQENRYVSKTKTTLTGLGFSKGRKITKGSVLFVCIGSTIGKVAQAAEECLTNQQINALSSFKGFDNNFIYELLEKNGSKIKLLAGVQAVPQINKTDFSNFKYFIPTLPEQQKIASFLSAVDEKIQLLSRKKELLEQYKKGVMQQLFLGKLRFKDENGRDYPDWEEKKLKDISTSIKRTTDRIIENVMTISGANGFMDQKDRFSQVIAAGSLSKYTHLLKDEFAYNRGNSKSYKYGCIYKLDQDEALIPYVYHSFKLNYGIPEFMQQIFKAKYLDSQLRGLISSSARMDGLLNIGASSFFQVKVIFPCIEEQQKIANFLSSIDNKIENTVQEINKIQGFKKGLLQQMFV